MQAYEVKSKDSFTNSEWHYRFIAGLQTQANVARAYWSRYNVYVVCWLLPC